MRGCGTQIEFHLKKEMNVIRAKAVIGIEFDGSIAVGGEVEWNEKMMVVKATRTAINVRMSSKTNL